MIILDCHMNNVFLILFEAYDYDAKMILKWISPGQYTGWMLKLMLSWDMRAIIYP